MMINFQAAFLSFPPSRTLSLVKTRLRGARRSIMERARLNACPASVDGRRRMEPVGDEGMDEGGVVPKRFDSDELKYEDEGRAGEEGVMAMGDEIIDADMGREGELEVNNCSWMSFS